MEFERHGSFLVPAGTAIKDLGGKTERLLEVQEIAKQHRFNFPKAVGLPWQTFAKAMTRAGYDAEYGFRTGMPIGYEEEFYGPQEREDLASALSHIKYPFLSSSAPGEDSLVSRMPGVYESRFGVSLEETIAPAGQSYADAHISSNLYQLHYVLRSYFGRLASGLREKHAIPHQGMGVLIREIVGGKQHPPYSFVISTGFEGSVRAGVIQGMGDEMMSGGQGTFYRYENGKFDKTPPPQADLKRLIERTLAFEAELSLPEGFGGEYEIAYDWSFRPYLLQAPLIPLLKDIGDIPGKNNALADFGEMLGSAQKPFSSIVYCYWPIDANSVELTRINEINRAHKDYLLIVRNLPRADAAPAVYNAAGIIEFTDEQHGRYSHWGDAISHYNTLFRTEGILFTQAQLDQKHIDRFDEMPGRVKIIAEPGMLMVNELRGQAGLYF